MVMEMEMQMEMDTAVESGRISFCDWGQWHRGQWTPAFLLLRSGSPGRRCAPPSHNRNQTYRTGRCQAPNLELGLAPIAAAPTE